MPFVSLPSKPQAQIAYDYYHAHDTSVQTSALIVFVNGLGLPASSWRSVISIVQASYTHHKLQFLTYDRFGQGASTDKDPLDSEPGKDPGYGHDILDATQDLQELIEAVTSDGPTSRCLILVAASIGAHIARLYAHKNRGQVSGILILDSNIGNQEQTYLWPDPHAANFNVAEVEAEDCTPEQYLDSYTKMRGMFGSDVKNPEALDRRNVKHLLPDPASPKLVAPDGKGIWLTVVGHDPKAFADESLKTLGIPRSVSMRFSNPYVPPISMIPWE